MKAARLHHASLPERIGYLEKNIGDSADKHARKLEALKGAHDKRAKGREATQDRHASVDDRIKHLEKLLGDSVDEHARKLAQLKDAHGKHAKDRASLHSAHGHHASIGAHGLSREDAW